MRTRHLYPRISLRKFSYEGFKCLFFAIVILFGSHYSHAQVKNSDKHFDSSDIYGQSTIFKVNASNVVLGELSMGIERSISSQTSAYGNLAWIHKSRTDMNAAGFGVNGGIRYYHTLPLKFLNLGHQTSTPTFTGNFVSLEGRMGMMHRIITLEKSSFNLKYRKIALHYGIQQVWHIFFINAEIGPSWGVSDFMPTGLRRYYHDGWNLDGRLTLGIVF